MGGNEQNVVERQRFLQNTHGLSLTQSGIIRGLRSRAQTGGPRRFLGCNLLRQSPPIRLTHACDAANFAPAFDLLGRMFRPDF
jgi:hypothetical protein